MQFTIAGLNKETDEYVDTYDTTKDRGEAKAMCDLLNKDETENHLKWVVKENVTTRQEAVGN